MAIWLTTDVKIKRFERDVFSLHLYACSIHLQNHYVLNK